MSRVLRVLAPNPGPFTLEGTNTWVVGDGPAVVIDPGPDDPSHLLAVFDAAERVSAIVVTHHHPDHAPGAPRLADASGAPVLAFAPREGEERLTPGQVLEVGGSRLRVVHTPGHTPDHVALWLEEEEALFTGDTVLGRGTSVVDPPEGDMGAYLRSLRELLALGPRLIYPGHGPVIFAAKSRLQGYLTHRERREEQVLAALAAGRATPADMVPDIYGGEVPEEMFPVAARSVLAHLLKLEREGRVARTGRPRDERFRAVDPRACDRCGRPAVPGSRYCRRCALEMLQEGPARPD
jgi:glyoxylase-like metal-dependent hydrolase (beta-lactamase superfamily II)